MHEPAVVVDDVAVVVVVVVMPEAKRQNGKAAAAEAMGRGGGSGHTVLHILGVGQDRHMYVHSTSRSRSRSTTNIQQEISYSRAYTCRSDIIIPVYILSRSCTRCKIVSTTRLRRGTGDPEGEVTPSERLDCGVSNCWVCSQQVWSGYFICVP